MAPSEMAASSLRMASSQMIIIVDFRLSASIMKMKKMKKKRTKKTKNQ